MPRVKPLDPEFQNKVRLREWVHIGVELKEMSLNDLAKKTGINRSTLANRLVHPETFRAGEIWAIERIVGSLEAYDSMKQAWEEARNAGLKRKIGRRAAQRPST